MATTVERLRAHPIIAVAVLCFGGLCSALTQTLVIPIQSELPGLLGTSTANASWVVTTSLLAAAVSMPLAGRLADMLGKRRLLLATASVLVAGSLVCAVSDSLVPMLVGRAMQGMAMGFIPIAISLIREITPPHLAGGAMAAVSATMGVGGAIGLPLSAWIVEVGDWHVLFLVMAAVALVVLLAVAAAVPPVDDAGGGRLDVVGAVILALGLVSFLLGVSKATTWGWGDARTVGAIVAGLVVLVAWGVYELRQDEPLVDLRASANLPVLLTNIAAIAIGFGMMAQAIVLPQLLQMPEATGYGLGQTILQAGLWMAPGGLVMMAFAPVSSRLIRSVGAKRTLMLGATVLGCGYLVALFLMDAPWQLQLAQCICSAGVGIGYAAMPTLVLDASPAHEAASAVGLNSLMRSIGTTIASGVLVTLMTSRTMDLGGTPVPAESGFQLCFIAGAAAAFLGVLIAAAIPLARTERVDEAELVEV